MTFDDDLGAEIVRRKDSKTAVASVVKEYYLKRAELGADEETMRNRLREIKKRSISKLDELLEDAKRSFAKNGVNVVVAKDAEAARRAINGIIGKDKRIVKSKSNTCKEIELEKLEIDGREITETDTGDFVVKLIGEHGVHQVIPAMHISPKQISTVIKRKFKKTVGENPEEITHFISEYLREKICDAQVGISGANVITSSGQIVLLENEGNISLVSRFPKKHIIVAGIEKIVPNLEDAMHVMRCATLWGSGREWPIYISVISGPSATADIENEMVRGAQGAYDVTVVLVDNGRSKLRRECPEILYCINCGACNNLCPPYRQVLDFFGGKYPGAKGIIYAMLEGEGKRNYMCNLCYNCERCCPAKIDLPKYIREARGKLRMESDKDMIKRIREYGNPFGKLEKGQTPDKLYCC
ncbi:MAG: LUD domain-containing protein [Candidatus Micrarchaeota archaeon]